VCRPASLLGKEAPPPTPAESRQWVERTGTQAVLGRLLDLSRTFTQPATFEDVARFQDAFIKLQSSLRKGGTTADLFAGVSACVDRVTMLGGVVFLQRALDGTDTDLGYFAKAAEGWKKLAELSPRNAEQFQRYERNAREKVVVLRARDDRGPEAVAALHALVRDATGNDPKQADISMAAEAFATLAAMVEQGKAPADALQTLVRLEQLADAL